MVASNCLKHRTDPSRRSFNISSNLLTMADVSIAAAWESVSSLKNLTKHELSRKRALALPGGAYAVNKSCFHPT